MEPKSGKPLRLFNPLAIWTDVALKSGAAMLDAAQAAISRPRPMKVAVIRTEDAPPSKAAPAPLSKSARKARKNAASRAKRRGR
jgi:hypothetical protein